LLVAHPPSLPGRSNRTLLAPFSPVFVVRIRQKHRLGLVFKEDIRVFFFVRLFFSPFAHREYPSVSGRRFLHRSKRRQRPRHFLARPLRNFIFPNISLRDLGPPSSLALPFGFGAKL